MSKIDGYNSYQQAFNNLQTEANGVVGSKNGKPDSRVAKWNPDEEAAIYEQSVESKQVTYNKPVVGVKKTEQTDVYDNLSEAAKALLDELKEKYGEDTDFVIANFSTDEEAQELMSHGTKKYTVLIDPELLEQMAADESVKEQYLNEIDAAKGQMESMLDELGEDADKVESIGISVGADGTISYFAQMKEASDKRSEEIQEGLKERREEAKAERKEKEKERIEERLKKTDEEKDTKKSSDKEEKKSNYITAGSIEELLSLIRGE